MIKQIGLIHGGAALNNNTMTAAKILFLILPSLSFLLGCQYAYKPKNAFTPKFKNYNERPDVLREIHSKSQFKPLIARTSKVEFLLIRKNRLGNWNFRITNNTRSSIEIVSLHPSYYPYASVSDEWQFFSNGKWRDITIQTDFPHYPYMLKPGQFVEFTAMIDSGIPGLSLSKNTLIRLVNGKFYSKPFEFGTLYK